MATARAFLNPAPDDEPSTPSERLSGEALRPSGFLAKGSAPKAGVPDSSKGERGGKHRWTVLEHFTRDGFVYQLRRRPIELRPRLTEREEQVVAKLRDGHSNKSIAYALGVAPSTVGVLIFRAATKMGAKSRTELVSAYARLKKDSDPR
jgi:DNA-binding NarL/FixJ family response regulator